MFQEGLFWPEYLLGGIEFADWTLCWLYLKPFCQYIIITTLILVAE